MANTVASEDRGLLLNSIKLLYRWRVYQKLLVFSDPKYGAGELALRAAGGGLTGSEW